MAYACCFYRSNSNHHTAMAKIETIIPFLIYWETGVKDSSADLRMLFEKARAKGVSSDPADVGGLTAVGVTLQTFRDYCKLKGLSEPVAKDLSEISFDVWLDLLSTLFWNRWHADCIGNGRVAHMLVDWVWTSGSYGITIPQKVLGVKADGVVGSKTLAAVNSCKPVELLSRLRQERLAYIDRICSRRPANLRFKTGWQRRINAI